MAQGIGGGGKQEEETVSKVDKRDERRKKAAGGKSGGGAQVSGEAKMRGVTSPSSIHLDQNASEPRSSQPNLTSPINRESNLTSSTLKLTPSFSVVKVALSIYFNS